MRTATVILLHLLIGLHKEAASEVATGADLDRIEVDGGNPVDLESIKGKARSAGGEESIVLDKSK